MGALCVNRCGNGWKQGIYVPLPPGTPVSYSVQLLSARLPVQTLTEHQLNRECRWNTHSKTKDFRDFKPAAANWGGLVPDALSSSSLIRRSSRWRFGVVGKSFATRQEPRKPPTKDFRTHSLRVAKINRSKSACTHISA